ncbi:MAG: N-6 DNA methylase [Methanobrevibacter smithii]|nr:N-6 DNA methylase [Methanobrevibacter smithii]MEE0719538.1 N-6 DNA methylase [Methanobrevibacter smithii]
MENYGNYLKEKLWEISSELSNNKDINEFKKYILGFIFYKYLSEKIDFTLSEELKIDNLTFEEAYNIPDYSDALKDEAFDSLGYFIEPEFLFKNLVEQAKVEDENFLSNVERALKKVTDSVIGRESAPDFENLFSDINLNAPILGNSVSSRSKSIGELFTELNSVDFKINEDVNYLADSFEFLITNFAIATGSQANKLYTPKTISNLISKLVTYGKDRILNVFDPACGSCSLLLNIKNEVSISNYFGQEIIQTTYNHARMNMILHDVHFEDFDIKQGDSIENPKFLDDKFEFTCRG